MPERRGILINRSLPLRGEEVLTDECLEFLEDLENEFGGRRLDLLESREERQESLDGGVDLDFLPETKIIRDGDWTIPPLPLRMLDRRVEITGPPDRKMVINALNSGATCFMADLEDSSTPTWNRVIEGQINLEDACHHTLRFFDKSKGKKYGVRDSSTTLLLRPRGLHLDEKHMLLGGRPLSGSLVDFGIFFINNAVELSSRDEGPYFYLPKLEHYTESWWWHDVFEYAENYIGLARGTIRATVLIETLPAAFQMDEILYSLGVYAAGLNCGRWDYLFSLIKTYRNWRDKILPDRSSLTMECPNMRAYSKLAIETCHKRGAMCIGGMAAQIPVKDDPEANQEAFARVRKDKEREFNDGHDGSWVAHPGLVETVREIFSKNSPVTNQMQKRISEEIKAADLLELPKGEITENGLRNGIQIAIRYIESWLKGTGCVPIFNLMEDAATAEISRAQVWQWVHHGVYLSEGGRIDEDLIKKLVREEVAKIEKDLVWSSITYKFSEAAEIFENMATAKELDNFMTLKIYDKIVNEGM